MMKFGDVNYLGNVKAEKIYLGNNLVFKNGPTWSETYENVALGKSALATHEYSGYPASNITDGDLNTRWSAKSASDVIIINLDSLCLIDKFTINKITSISLKQYQIYGLDINSEWVQLLNIVKEDPTVGENSYSIQPIEVSKIKMTFANHTNIISIYELQVFGHKQKGVK